MALKKPNDGRLAYGEETETDVFPDSTVDTDYKVHDGHYMPVKFKTYKERVKVKNEEDVLTEFLKFRTKLKDQQPLEVKFEIEKTKKLEALGFYYIWKTYRVRVDE